MVLRLLLLFLAATGFISRIHAQEEPNSPPSYGYGSEYIEPARFDLSRIRLGTGVNFVVKKNFLSTTGSNWLNNHNVFVFDASWSFGKKKKWVAGTSYSSQRLIQEKEKAVFYAPNYNGYGLASVSASYLWKANLLSHQFYVEQNTFALGHHLQVFSRVDFGYMRYGAGAGISTVVDTSDGFKTIVHERVKSVVMTGGFGIGIRYEYKFIGLKAFIGYQFQTMNTFITKDDFSEWSWKFDTDTYDFQDYPDKNLFSITHPEFEKIKSRNNYSYLQLVLYFSLGSKE